MLPEKDTSVRLRSSELLLASIDQLFMFHISDRLTWTFWFHLPTSIYLSRKYWNRKNSRLFFMMVLGHVIGKIVPFYLFSKKICMFHKQQRNHRSIFWRMSSLTTLWLNRPHFRRLANIILRPLGKSPRLLEHDQFCWRIKDVAGLSSTTEPWTFLAPPGLLCTFLIDLLVVKVILFKTYYSYLRKMWDIRNISNRFN